MKVVSDASGFLMKVVFTKIFGGVKFQHFGPPLWPKTVLLTAEKVGSAQN